MASNRRQLSHRVAFLEKVYVEDRRRWHEQTDQWREQERHWREHREFVELMIRQLYQQNLALQGQGKVLAGLAVRMDAAWQFIERYFEGRY